MRARKGWISLFVLLVLGSIWMNQITVQAESSYTKKVEKKNDNFKLEAQYGIDGMAFYDMPNMISVTVESKENFTGMLRVIPGTYYGSASIAYGEDISVPAGEKKTYQFVPTAIGNNGVVTVQILDDKEQVIYQEKHTIVMENAGSKVIIGVLSDDYSALSYFDGNSMMIDNTQTTSSIFELTADNFPTDSKALMVMQYLIIDNFDTASLSNEQYASLKDWVQSGGILILGLGSNYKNVLNIFNDSFVSGTLGDLQKKKISWDLSVGAASPDAYYDIQDPNLVLDKGFVDSQIESAIQDNANGNDTMDSTEETGDTNQIGDVEETISGEQESAEEVIENQTALTMDCIEFAMEDGEPFSTFTTAESASVKEIGRGKVIVLGYSLSMEPLSSADFKQFVARFLIEHAQSQYTISKFYGNDTERSSMYAGVDVARMSDLSNKPSVLLYGFILILYVVLVGPVLYVILKKVNKREKIWIAIPIVTLAFTAIIYLTGFMYRMNKPLVSTFTLIELEDKAKSEKIYTNIICPKPKEYRLQFAQGYTGFRSNVDEYDYNVFDNSQNELTIDYMLKRNSKGMEVYLDNSEPFEQKSFLINKSSENNIGSIEHNLTCSTTGFEGTITNNTCYDLQDLVVTFEGYLCLVGDVKKGETVAVDPSKIVVMANYGTFDKLYSDKQMYVDREMYLHYQINNMIEQNVIDKQAYGKGYIWAGITSYKPELIDGSNVKRAGSGVILTSYNASYSDISGAYYPMIDGFAVASQGEYDSNDRCIYTSEAVVTYSFGDIKTIQELHMYGKEQLSYGVLADVYAYNVQTGEYEQIFVDTDTLSGADLQKYLLDKTIVLKYVGRGSEYGSYFVPKISVKGEQ